VHKTSYKSRRRASHRSEGTLASRARASVSVRACFSLRRVGPPRHDRVCGSGRSERRWLATTCPCLLSLSSSDRARHAQYRRTAQHSAASQHWHFGSIASCSTAIDGERERERERERGSTVQNTTNPEKEERVAGEAGSSVAPIWPSLPLSPVSLHRLVQSFFFPGPGGAVPLTVFCPSCLAVVLDFLLASSVQYSLCIQLLLVLFGALVQSCSLHSVKINIHTLSTVLHAYIPALVSLSSSTMLPYKQKLVPEAKILY